MYDVLSRVYDPWQQSYGKDYSTIILPRLLRTIRDLRIPTSDMLDVACGTGTLSVLMAQRGWHVWGVDLSEGMLKHAQAKRQRLGLPLRFMRADMRSFSLGRRFALATCLFDSLNHVLRKRELLNTFRCIAEHLQPGGYFLFDVNNETCYHTIWRQSHVSRTREFTLVIDSGYAPSRKRAKGIVTLQLAEAGESRPISETIHQRLYTGQELRQLLTAAGLQIVSSEDFNFTDVPEVGNVKTWWVARKPS